MHTIHFTPQRRDDVRITALSWSGDVLSIDGQTIDLSGVTEGTILPASAVAHDLVIGEITRTAGALSVTLLLPLGRDASLAARFPSPVTSATTVALPQTH